MHKEPVALYTFRFVKGFALIAISLSLYCKMQSVKIEIHKTEGNVLLLEESVHSLLVETEQLRTELLAEVKTSPNLG